MRRPLVIPIAAPPSNDAQAVTRAESIRRALADDIVRGRLPPGAPLEEVELARAFGVSRTPIREALRQLEAEGFAQPRPRRGAVVARIAPERLAEMFEAMAELEAACAAQAARRMGPAGRRALEAAQAACGQAMRSSDVDAYRAANDAFHEAVWSGAGNVFLGELAAGVRRRVAPYRRLQFDGPGRLQASFAEHARIVEAILRGDAAQAAAEMRRHIAVVERAAEALAPALGGDAASA